MSPTLEEVAERGRAAAELMRSSAFLQTVDDVSVFHMAAIAACPNTDEHLPTLRYHHTMHAALAELVSDLQSRVIAGAEAEQAIAIRDAKDEYEDNE